MRPGPLERLLASVVLQTRQPKEILVVDGSTDRATETMIQEAGFENLTYFKVGNEDRGLTKQRNFGIQRVAADSELVCFLDDDTLLEPDYFEQVVSTFQQFPEVVGVGGVAVNENRWKKLTVGQRLNKIFYYQLDGYSIKESSRNIIRNLLGLNSHLKPGQMPEYSHGRTYSYPLNNKCYEVDLLIGMSMSFRKVIFSQLKFSTYFEGYGLYEDADFCLRARSYGKNIINTAARLQHFHESSGRPNQYHYGKMVVRNGWYVWRVAYPNPSLKARFKWHAITILLTSIRLSNTITTHQRKAAFTEALGRTVGWWSLFFSAPKQK